MPPPPPPSASSNEAVSPRKERPPTLIRHRFEAYLDKVFGFSALVRALPKDGGFPSTLGRRCLTPFSWVAMQMPSLLPIEAECHRGVLAKRIGPVSDDTLAYSLERQSPEPVFALSCEIARRLKRNGLLRSAWSRGLVVGAVDGIEICSSLPAVARPVPIVNFGFMEGQTGTSFTNASLTGNYFFGQVVPSA